MIIKNGEEEVMKILVLFSFIFSLNAVADCYDNLLNNKEFIRNDSYVYRIHDPKGVYLKDKTKTSILGILSKSGCEIRKLKISCGEVIKDVRETEICYCGLTEGYFIVSSDYQSNLTLIFNRWD